MTVASADVEPARRNRAAGRYLVGITVIVFAIALFVELGSTPLFDVDEGAFGQSTIEMFQRGDFLSPHLNGKPRYDKPILIYWLQAASVRAFGVNEFALRLPSALCAIAWVWMTGAFASRLFGRRAGVMAAAITGLSLGVTTIARAATADALLNMAIAATMFAAWLQLETGKRRWLYAAFGAGAIGFLAKGPVAIAIPLIVTALLAAMRGGFLRWLKSVFDPYAIALFAVIALPWYAVLVHRDGWGFVAGFFGRHNLDRFAEPLQGHRGSLFYYIPFAIAATMPFTAFAGSLVRRLRAVWRDDRQRFLLLWFATVFVVFSIAATKLPHYIMYGMTGVFILMAVRADAWRSRVAVIAGPVVVIVFLLLLPTLAKLAIPRVGADARAMLGGAIASVPTGYYAFAALALAAALWLMIDARIALRHAAIAASAIALTALHVLAAPMAAGARQVSIKDAARFARDHHVDVIAWHLNAPSFSVYYGRPVEHREPRPGDVVLTTTTAIDQLRGRDLRTLFTQNGIVLVEVR